MDPGTNIDSFVHSKPSLFVLCSRKLGWNLGLLTGYMFFLGAQWLYWRECFFTDLFDGICDWQKLHMLLGSGPEDSCCEPFCSLWDFISWACTQDTAMGGAGTAVKLASHFHMARHLVEAWEDGLDHASLCKEAQALGTRKQLQPGFLFHPGRQWMLRGTLSMRYTVAWLKALDEYQRASLRKICDSKQKCATAIQGNAGDVLLLHPHLAHSSTTNVRFGRDVRAALTKRAYWITGMVSGIWLVFEMLDGWVPLVFCLDCMAEPKSCV